MKKTEVTLLLQAQYNEKSKDELVGIFEKKVKLNQRILIGLGILFLVQLVFQATGGIVFWLIVLWFAGNQWYLQNQLRRFREIVVQRD
ncbi:hypothetical protein [Cerasicoccus fimbriatus]|uniref:hypothetical protein n=1 Tax=Cerasicoccus fimbriatus TaxID=3014554 RepID=UPI0022B4668C|nr:hypothetical protein [Cerasicoccus sp. TK19100]